MADSPRPKQFDEEVARHHRLSRVSGVPTVGAGGMSLLKATGSFDSDLIAWGSYTVDGAAGVINDSPYQPAIPAGDWILQFLLRFSPSDPGRAAFNFLRNESPQGGDYWVDLATGNNDLRSIPIHFVGGADLMVSVNFYGAAEESVGVSLLGWGRA